MAALDIFDLRILQLLQNDARLPMERISERVGLSVPACYRRIRHLRDQGVIERDMAVVSPRAMGWPITMIVLVTLERDRGWIMDGLVARLRVAPEVTDVWAVTGEYDLVLYMVARDMEDYDSFTRRVLHAEEHVRSFKTLVVMQYPKKRGALPIAGVPGGGV